MHVVSPFLRNAHEIFATARQADADDCRMAILVQEDGAIHICPASDWDLECLRLQHGAAMAYAVSRHGAKVRVDARSPGESCTLETAGPVRLPGLPMGDYPQYRTIQ